ncbi:hypothetical protein [Polynucleobacter necessarius]|uniref:hypothetical protein n=1 Tax=Polynucleobacter necessarius TaxID=576610 RepID=UPI001E3FDCA8|nr:hypothetical protein [Polynucleobacter necessarius]
MSQSQAMKGVLVVFGLFVATSAQSQNNSQALSPAELNRINNQPLAPAVSGSGAMNNPEQRKPNYQYKDKNGTTISEYRDMNAPTQVDVKMPYTSYEMAPPTSVMPGPPKETDLISVPSISIPLR